MDTQEKMRENRLRATAKRQGLKLHKSRLRDPRAIGYNTWSFVEFLNSNHDCLVGEHMDIDEVEQYLKKTHLDIDEVERFLTGGA
jgi:hypothetical protein